MPHLSLSYEEEKKIYINVYKSYKAAQFIKTIRSDQDDFWAEFVMGVLPNRYEDVLGEQFHLPLLRIPTDPTKKFKINKDGVWHIDTYRGLYTKEQKAGHSKKQAVSVISIQADYYTGVCFRTSEAELTGVIFFSNHPDKDPLILTSIIMSQDGDTYNKPYYYSSKELANNAFKTLKENKHLYTRVSGLIKDKPIPKIYNHNEILARLMWDPENEEARCQIGIFTDNLKSRLIAQLRAKDLKMNTNKDFIPISFYISENKDNKIYPYYLQAQQNDLNTALNSTDPSIMALAVMVDFLNNPTKLKELIKKLSSSQELLKEFYNLLLNKKMTIKPKIFLFKEILNNQLLLFNDPINMRFLATIFSGAIFTHDLNCFKKMYKIVQKFDADILRTKDAYGLTPYDYAKIAPNKDIMLSIIRKLQRQQLKNYHEKLIITLQINNESEARNILKIMELHADLTGPIKVVMFTASCWGTMGDPSAAAKLMQKLTKTNLNIKFLWLVKIDIESKKKQITQQKIQSLIQNTQGISLLVLEADEKSGNTGWEKGWPELWRNPQAIKKLQAADLLCSYPTGHYFKKEDHKKFEILNKPFVSITEYDFQKQDNKEYQLPKLAGDKAKEYKTGFGLQSKGIFIEKPEVQDLSNLSKTDYGIYSLLLNNLSIEDYVKQHQLFFGYFNSNNTMLAPNKLIEIENFIIACIRKCLKENSPPKNIDLFVNISPEQLHTFLQKTPFLFTQDEQKILSCIEYFKKDATGNITKHQNLANTQNFTGKVAVRILNGFPVDKDSMQCLMQNSDAFIGLTGDQSFAEGLALGKLICYQQMVWKQDLFKNFLELCATNFGNRSLIYRFYNCQLTQNTENNWRLLIKIYNEDLTTLKLQAQQLANYLLRKKQLDKLLLPELTKNILEFRTERFNKKFFPVQQHQSLTAKIEEIEYHSFKQCSKQINITVFTAYMHARGGDLTIAIIYIKEMIKRDPNIKITWIVKRDIEGHDTNIRQLLRGISKANIDFIFIDSADYKNVTIINGKVYLNSMPLQELSPQELSYISDSNWKTNVSASPGGWSELQQKMYEQDFYYKIASTHMFCVIPNLHRFVDRDRLFFTQLHKPFIAISEYDFKTTKHVNDILPPTDDPTLKHYIKKYETGFSEQALGIYVDEPMLSKKTLKYIHKDDEKFKDYLTNGSITKYKQNHTLFYGYFFLQIAVKLSKENQISVINLKNYITLCITTALDDPQTKPTIDIVIPARNTTIILDLLQEIINEQLDQAYRNKIQKVQISHQASYKKIFQEQIIYNNDFKIDGKIIRLINPIKIYRGTVQCLLNDAEPLCGATGDQSLIEGLVKGKLICYQIMKWKQDFFNCFLKYVEDKFTINSQIYQFYNMQKSSSYSVTKTNILQIKFNLQQISKFYLNNQSKLKQQAKILAEFILTEKNLLNPENGSFKRFVKDAQNAKKFIEAKFLQNNTRKIPIILSEVFVDHQSKKRSYQYPELQDDINEKNPKRHCSYIIGTRVGDGN